MNSTKDPVYTANLVYKMAQKYAQANALTLTKDECEALELAGRRLHWLTRIFKPRSMRRIYGV